ncbi:MAG TPA: hydroxyisourate hydrolase [Devosia sp.]|nr:hydroxyisourate hydrolase [Devosia sp.]
MADCGRLTTHVLDTAHGKPAADMGVELFVVQGESRTLLQATRTNVDGRCNSPLLSGENMVSGVYELVFQVGDYFSALGVETTSPAFLDTVPVRFGIGEADAHYHVPLLVAPFAYSTYRGS